MVSIIFARSFSLNSLLTISIGDEICSETLDQIPDMCWRILMFALVVLRPPGAGSIRSRTSIELWMCLQYQM